MTWLQRQILRLAAFFIPSLNKLLRSAGGTIERAETELLVLRERDSARRRAILEEQQEIREAIQMIAPAWLPEIGAGGKLQTAESLREAKAPEGVVRCVERLWELELALEDRGWVRELTLANFEFSLFGIHRIIAMCRLYFLKNPFFRRGVQVASFYVFGRGVSISSDDEDENEVIQKFLNDPRNQSEIGHRALVKKAEALWTDGNIYWVFFEDQQTGKQLLRSIDPIEIVEIVNDPDDSSVEQYIHRKWMSQQFDPATGNRSPEPSEAWYPALDYEPTYEPPTIKGVKVRWETPVLHSKRGGFSKWQWGVPLGYAALDYARAMTKIINNWCSIQEALARFSWQVETQGGLPAIANFKQTLATTLATGDGSFYEQNPPPTVAAPFITGPGNKLIPIKTAGTVDSPEVGRRVAHLIYMVFGLPETFFADASVGTVATATSLDRPTELKFMEEQAYWNELIQKIIRRVLAQSETAPKGKLREARTSKPKAQQSTISVVFPSILEHDILSQIQAIVAAATLGGFECTGIDERIAVGLLLQELGVEDWQTVIEVMYPEDEYEPLMDRTKLLKVQQDAALEPPAAAVAPGAPPVGAPGLPPDQGPTGTPEPAKPPAPPLPGQASPALPPVAKKARPKHIESDKVNRAVATLRIALSQLKEGRRNGAATR
jgi:hypothetical protein